MSFAHDVEAPAELVSDHANFLVGPKLDYATKAKSLDGKHGF